jgi:error-prone DNA polymerase
MTPASPQQPLHDGTSLLPAYAELHCLSNFSFLRGASHAEELVERAAALGYTALAVTDECSVAGVVRAHLAARDTSIRLLIGSELRLADGPVLVLLAENRTGYGNLAQLITTARRRGEKGQYHVERADFRVPERDTSSSATSLDVAPGSANDTCIVGDDPARRAAERARRRTAETRGPAPGHAGHDHLLALLVPRPADDGATLAADARWLAERFPGRCWIACELHGGPDDRGRLAMLESASRASGVPLVAAGDVHMHVRSRRRLQDVLTAVRVGRPIAECGHALFPNGERHLRLRMRLAQVYPARLLAETLVVADRCRFSLDELRYEYPEEIVPPGMTPTSYLRALTEAGLARRFPEGVPAGVRQTIEHELALVADLAYEPFFLTVHDVVRFANERGILCQGRGSAANSAVCYALGITEVDPARMSMLFERFVSRERNEPPDIDVDFEHQRREEVIQYIYRKYGRERAAIAATVISYRPKSAIRDVGKALGLSLEQVDRLAKSLAWWDGREVAEDRFREAGLDPAAPASRRLLEMLRVLVGFPRHLSQHVGGFVITRGLLSRLVPVENAAMADRSVIQWDKDDIDALGLLKVDVLALGMLSAIRRALGLLSSVRGAPLRMQDIPAEDPATYRMIQRADTMGVFQIESRAQMSMLPRLKPATFFDLVIEVAIVRPGPIQGGMVHPYLRRRAGLEAVSYPSEAVKGVLERTLGVPIFQEQVMQLAIVAAGFSPGEADRLRRAMAAWKKRGGLEPFEKRLKDGMRERGYTAEFADQIYRQILGFGEYGFPESHSASFALLVYVSAWLKCHAPAAFCGGLLNSQPMGFYAPSQLVQDARRHGVTVLPIDVATSDRDCTLDDERTLRLGLRLVRGLGEDGALRLVEARAAAGPFADVDDLARRAALGTADLRALAAAGALRSLAPHRRAAYWHVSGIRPEDGLLADAPIVDAVPALEAPSEGEDIVADYHATGLTLGRHPLALLRERLQARRLATAEDLRAMPHGRLARAAGIVTGRQRPDTAQGIVFVTLEDETGYVNVVVHPRVLERQRREILGARLMSVYGVIEREGEVVHLVARRVADDSALLGRLTTRSRDFH